MKHHILLSTVALLAACQTAPVAPAPTETTTVEVIETVAPPAAPTQGQQWLYGSAEARIALKQDWNAIAAYVEAKAASRPNTSVVPVEG